MDMESCLPLLYPLRYHIDHLAHRSLSTQSASLQSVKFLQPVSEDDKNTALRRRHERRDEHAYLPR